MNILSSVVGSIGGEPKGKGFSSVMVAKKGLAAKDGDELQSSLENDFKNALKIENPQDRRKAFEEVFIKMVRKEFYTTALEMAKEITNPNEKHFIFNLVYVEMTRQQAASFDNSLKSSLFINKQVQFLIKKEALRIASNVAALISDDVVLQATLRHLLFVAEKAPLKDQIFKEILESVIKSSKKIKHFLYGPLSLADVAIVCAKKGLFRKAIELTDIIEQPLQKDIVIVGIITEKIKRGKSTESELNALVEKITTSLYESIAEARIEAAKN